MALLTEASQLRTFVQEIRKVIQYNEAFKDDKAEELMSPSPIMFGSFLQTLLINETEQNLKNLDSLRDKDDKKKLVVRVFEEEGTSQKFQFVKEFGAFHPPPPNNLLATLITKQKVSEQPREVKVRTYNLTIFMPTGDKFTVQAIDKSTVEDIIKMTIQQYEIRCLETKKTQRINMNPKAYVLRFAEEDGVPDEDFPALGKTQEIGQFLKGSTTFAICPDTSFKMIVSSTNSSKGMAVILFKVTLPKEEGFVSIAFQPNLTLRTVMENVCRKRGFEASDYEFDWPENTPNPPPKPLLALDSTLGNLQGMMQLRLIRKETFKEHKRKSSKDSIGLKRERSSSSFYFLSSKLKRRGSTTDPSVLNAVTRSQSKQDLSNSKEHDK